MPQPWLLNLWACNPYVQDTDREVALSQEALGVNVQTVPDQVVAVALPGEDQANYSTEDWFVSLTQVWPEVAPVIPTGKQILMSDTDAVLAFANARRPSDKQRTKPECFDYAHYQLDKAGFRPTNSPAVTHDSLYLILEYPEGEFFRTEVQVEQMADAVDYIKGALLAGMPILVGLRLRLYGRRPNDRKKTPYVEPTNHYVVIVAMGQDQHGCYFGYFDYSHRYKEEDRLYLQPTLMMSKLDNLRNLSELRRSQSR